MENRRLGEDITAGLGDYLTQKEQEYSRELSEARSHLEERVKEVKTDLEKDIREVKTDLKDDLREVKADLRDDLKGIRDDINGTRNYQYYCPHRHHCYSAGSEIAQKGINDVRKITRI